MKYNKRILIISFVVIIIAGLGVKLYFIETTRLSKMKIHTGYSFVESDNKISNINKVSTSNFIPNYEIIKQEKLHNIKKSIDIRLSDKVTKQQLKNIALEIKADLKESYERIFIVYYLPEMKVGNGGWATTHFNPNLDVEILGLTIEQERQIIESKPLDNAYINIGHWIDESPYAGCVMTLYRDGNSIFLGMEYGDGTSGRTKMKEISKNGKIIYIEDNENDFGEYYLINSKGNLDVFDDQGLIFTAIKK